MIQSLSSSIVHVVKKKKDLVKDKNDLFSNKNKIILKNSFPVEK